MSSPSSKVIRTVLGDMSAEYYGHIQCHEHIFLRKGASYTCNHALYMDDPERSCRELEDYRRAGGTMIVDAQPGGYGRDAAMLQQLARRSGVSIVAVTGFQKKCFLEEGEDRLGWTEERLTRLYCSEITQGMLSPEGVPLTAKAGLIKVSCDEGCFADKVYLRMFSAAAEAAVQTGANLLVHTEAGVDSLQVVRLMELHGIRPERLILCHLDRTNNNLNYHKELLLMGCYLCYDSVHRLKYCSDEEEMSLLCAVKEACGVDKLLLSLDTTNERLRAYYASDMGLDYILTSWIPRMKQNGFTEEEITRICCQNAVEALAIQKGE